MKFTGEEKDAAYTGLTHSLKIKYADPFSLHSFVGDEATLRRVDQVGPVHPCEPGAIIPALKETNSKRIFAREQRHVFVVNLAFFLVLMAGVS